MAVGTSRVSRRSRHPVGRAGASGARTAAAALEGPPPPPPCPRPRDTGVCGRSPGPARRRPCQQPRNTLPRGRSYPSRPGPRPDRVGRKRKQPGVPTSGAEGVVGARHAPGGGPGDLFGIRPSVCVRVRPSAPSARPRQVQGGAAPASSALPAVPSGRQAGVGRGPGCGRGLGFRAGGGPGPPSSRASISPPAPLEDGDGCLGWYGAQGRDALIRPLATVGIRGCGFSAQLRTLSFPPPGIGGGRP
ncbi:uncharacterized protein LOC111149360 [Enhydra lutris kenyoni]|uniref:Uncharacterized protein LOC111149360 n=1 Tax=Enhydra lutris kenyoni TaxID=391180 RepID=A0A2Y9JWT4_ENHLU|nr:uncharacterized protein LOC111149360 [Enhydra lutris kenyoni]